jgi:replication factor C subunit 2/4
MQLPHLLFYGPPGTGKTSAIVALAKQLFGPTFWKSRVLELNASDDRGINVIRTKVKKFAEQMSSKNPNPQFLCPGYKVIVLDEADSMTQEAQGALRRIIEDFSATTRFCIICNYITKVELSLFILLIRLSNLLVPGVLSTVLKPSRLTCKLSVSD